MTTRALLFVSVAGCGLTLGCDNCGNRIAKEIPSPDGANRAVIFERDCGATTDFSTHISILAVQKTLANKSGSIFIADGNRGAVPVDPRGVLDIAVVWKSSQLIEITYPARARIFLHAPEYRGIRITYKTN